MVSGEPIEAPPIVPRHVAVIMDGNGRWAKRQGLSIARGHRRGARTARELMKSCVKRGVKTLSIFAFSSENWLRPSTEVRALMSLFTLYLREEVEELHREQVRLRFIGDLERLRPLQRRKVVYAERLTAANSRCTLVVAVAYGGRWDIARAARNLAQQVADGQLEPRAVDEAALGQQLCLSDLPAPELLIRTGGEQRISNFMLWQCAYSELYFTPVLWPDFDADRFAEALAWFASCKRRFGRRGEDESC